MSFGKQPQSHAHLVVLALCVAACLAMAFWPRREAPAGPEEDAAVLVRGVLNRTLAPAPSEPSAK